LDEAAPEPAQLDTSASEREYGTSKLELQLREVTAERENYSRFLPWLTVGLGAATTLAGTAAGTAFAVGCDGACDSPAWIGMVVVAGTFIATVGAVWVVHSNAGLREIDSRRYHIEQELERVRASARGPEAAFPHAAPQLSWRFALR
jgi:hypothetical protein